MRRVNVLVSSVQHHYLCTKPEDVQNEDLLRWWYNHQRQYPHLFHMALDYHSIPCECQNVTTFVLVLISHPFFTTIGSSVGVERVFSQGCLVLPYVHNHLSSESTCALLCLSDWSACRLVKDCHIKTAAALPDIKELVEPEFQQGWEKTG
jgi:hypothetical protein